MEDRLPLRDGAYFGVLVFFLKNGIHLIIDQSPDLLYNWIEDAPHLIRVDSELGETGADFYISLNVNETVWVANGPLLNATLELTADLLPDIGHNILDLLSRDEAPGAWQDLIDLRFQEGFESVIDEHCAAKSTYSIFSDHAINFFLGGGGWRKEKTEKEEKQQPGFWMRCPLTIAFHNFRNDHGLGAGDLITYQVDGTTTTVADDKAVTDLDNSHQQLAFYHKQGRLYLNIATSIS